MNNQVIHIEADEASQLAKEYFIKICGFNREGDKYSKMLAEGLSVREGIGEKININAIVSAYQNDVISGDSAIIDSVTFTCSAFRQIKKESVKSVFAYLLTAGIYELDENAPIMNQLYADIWGTSFVDAGLEVLKKRLADGFAYEAFGPGFYGMDVDQLSKFFDLLDGSKIGMTIRGSGLMLPLKSCAGFLITVDDKSDLPDANCKNCRAYQKGCEFCHAFIKKVS